MRATTRPLIAAMQTAGLQPSRPDGVFANNFKGTEALKGFVNNWRTNPAMNGARAPPFLG